MSRLELAYESVVNNRSFVMLENEAGIRAITWYTWSCYERTPRPCIPLTHAFLWHFPFRLSVSWQVHSAIHIWPPSQYIVVLHLVVLFNTPTWLDSVLVLTDLVGSGLFTRRKTRKESEKWALSASICDQTKPTWLSHKASLSRNSIVIDHGLGSRVQALLGLWADFTPWHRIYN